VNRTVRTLLAAMLGVALVAALAGCSQPGGQTGTSAAPAKVRIGTLPTEDSLPLWVAERDGLFKKAGLDVTIQVFQSAQERDAALTAGAIDGFMGDLIAAATLRAGGVPVKVTTIMLGAKPSEGRFGIAVKPGSKITLPNQLANIPVGVSSATIQEYVLDSILTGSGVSTAKIQKEEVKKVPVRFELLMSGKLEAAALPEPFLSLAAKTGATIIADDTTVTASAIPTKCVDCTKTVAGEWARGANISQTVMVFSQKYLDDPAGSAAVARLLGVWDEAVALVNKDPDSFRALLVDKARLPEPLATSYAVNTYPTAQLPAEGDANAVLSWMGRMGYLKASVTYADLMWTAPAK
jgi:NitT/TauT family transport system substrate-binding protein